MPKKSKRVNVLDLIASKGKAKIVRASETIKEPYKPIYTDLVMPKPPKNFSIVASKGTGNDISIVVVDTTDSD